MYSVKTRDKGGTAPNICVPTFDKAFLGNAQRLLPAANSRGAADRFVCRAKCGSPLRPKQ